MQGMLYETDPLTYFDYIEHIYMPSKLFHNISPDKCGSLFFSGTQTTMNIHFQILRLFAIDLFGNVVKIQQKILTEIIIK